MMAGTAGPEEPSVVLLVPSCGFRKESMMTLTNKIWGGNVLDLGLREEGSGGLDSWSEGRGRWGPGLLV